MAFSCLPFDFGVAPSNEGGVGNVAKVLFGDALVLESRFAVVGLDVVAGLGGCDSFVFRARS